MNLLVKDTDRAIDQVTGIAVDSGGYVLSSQTATQDGFKSATIKMGVPVDQFENVMRQLRSIAFQVTNETSSGQDVSDEYVDQQSRLTNLEATAARVREFLKPGHDRRGSVEGQRAVERSRGPDRAGEGAHELSQGPGGLFDAAREPRAGPPV
jgi:Domain of unknown function (DUF4349)